ncbi:MAG: serine hydrolase [Acidobacteria bacterium]|nr:serine hydrolase [Acidobacteriota bacterium]
MTRRALLLCFLSAVCASSQTPQGAIRDLINRESKAKNIPIIAVAVIEDQRITFRYATGGAAPDSVYRVGSVSKLFTDVAIMQLVEKRAIDLDAPVTNYLINFHPHSSNGRPITLRDLMSHRAGLVREPPVGHYFDATPRTLEETVRSLNDTDLIYEPGRRTKYSNAGIAVVGRVVETLARKPFAQAVKDAVLTPLGMHNSAFQNEANLAPHLAKAFMWTYDGRRFQTPQFELGMSPAGSLYTTLPDLARFVSSLLAGGGKILQTSTLEKMWEPQFGSNYGIGFRLGKLDGLRTVSHGGAIYGFATDLTAIPSEKLGVIVICNVDSANTVATRIAQQSLRWIRAARRGESLVPLPETEPIPNASALAGRYGEADKAVDLTARNGKLYITPLRGGSRAELRQLGDDIITDDLHSYGTQLNTSEQRQPALKPAAAPLAFRSFLGEYGWDFNTLYILEREGKLTALIEWFDYYPLTQVSAKVFRFPDFGLYPDEFLTFTSEGARLGSASAGVLFPKRSQSLGSVFRIIPVRPVAELRREALAATPPQETGPFRKSELIHLRSLDRTIRLDIRYATTENFLSTPVYTKAAAMLQRPAAEALARANKELAAHGYGLLVHDAYRPWSVTKIFWDATPPDKRDFVADPSKGSRHNRGCAVDLTLYDLRTKKPVEMTGLYDEMSTRSYPDYPGSTSLARYHRDLLRTAMERQGFQVFDNEWWHFDYKDWKAYAIQNEPYH